MRQRISGPENNTVGAFLRDEMLSFQQQDESSINLRILVNPPNRLWFLDRMKLKYLFKIKKGHTARNTLTTVQHSKLNFLI